MSSIEVLTYPLRVNSRMAAPRISSFMLDSSHSREEPSPGRGVFYLFDPAEGTSFTAVSWEPDPACPKRSIAWASEAAGGTADIAYVGPVEHRLMSGMSDGPRVSLSIGKFSPPIEINGFLSIKPGCIHKKPTGRFIDATSIFI